MKNVVYVTPVLCIAVLVFCGGVDLAMASNAEDGGSGLVRVDYAWSMPFRGILLSSHVGYFSSEGAPGSARYMTLSPSLTKGLSNGFEGALALPFEILTSNLEGSDFERRFDVRKRNLLGKLRWSGPLAGPGVRFGLQSMVGLPLFESSTRPGGDRKPSRAFDVGASALLSANVGWFDFPIRIHANVGYWWSRDDGAVYMRQLPGALPLSGADIVHNDLFLGGLAVEAGLRRFVLFAELSTEHLVGARAQVRGSENLWRLTPGIRTEIGQNIGLTAGVSFDLSSDDARTAFNPKDAYPDIEFRVGLLLGTVLTRQRYERSRHRDQVAWQMDVNDQLLDMMQPETSDHPAPIHEADVRTPMAAVPAAPSPALPRAASIPASNEDLRAMEERLSRLEIQMRMAQIEARLRELEGSALPPTGGLAVSRPGPAPVVQPVPETADDAIADEAVSEGVQPPTVPPAQAPASPPAPASAPPPVASAAPAPVSAPTPAPTPAPTLAIPPTLPSTASPPVAPVDVREHTSQVVVESRQPAVTVSPIGPVAVETARDPETELIWADIDRLVAEFAEYNAEAESPPASPPVAPAAVEAVSLPAVEAASVPSFALALGERAMIAEVDLLADDPLTGAAARQALQTWAESLAAYPDVQVVLLVHVDSGDRNTNLRRSTELADRLRDYMLISGAPAGSVAALGMGSAEPVVNWGTADDRRRNTRLEVERLR